MFTPEEREQLREKLVSAAQTDPRITGAAHLGSAALGEVDAWSDIDLALCLAPEASFDGIVHDWTMRLYRDCGAAAHLDVKRGDILYRVFLLQNTLQIDVSFWPAADFGAVGPKFCLIFGAPNEPRPAPVPDFKDLIGMGWLYALHVRSAIARGRWLQAEYMLSGMRNEMLALACRRHGLVAIQGRGIDDLPQEFKVRMVKCFPRSLEAAELRRTFGETTDALLAEIGYTDPELAGRLRDPLCEIAGAAGAA
jgi:hypothetical protein